MDEQPDGALAMKLAVIEVLDRDGHVRLLVPVWAWPLAIGRAIDCDVVLDDAHAAARHATLVEREGVLTLQVGDTVNGVQLTRRRLAAQQTAELSPGEIFQVGNTRLRVRRATDDVPPERPLLREAAGSRLSILVLTVVFMAWSAVEQWLRSDPGGRFIDYLPVLLTVPVGLAFWSLFWSVGSKLVRHRFDFWSHAHIALRYSLMGGIVGVLLPLAAFSLGWTFLSRITTLATIGVTWAMVLAHLTLIQPTRRRLLTGVMSALLVGGMSLFLIYNYQVHDRVFSELYVSKLGPPSLRLAPTVPATRFIDEARSLKAVLDSHIDDGDDDGSSFNEQVSMNGPDAR